MISPYDDNYFMKQAIFEAEKAYLENEVPVGAVVVCKGKIIARAHNMVEKLKDVTAHAEMLSITAASEALGTKFLEECVLYVTLEPCPMCAGALHWARIGKVIYAAADEKAGFLRMAPTMLHPKTQLLQWHDRESVVELMKKFFRDKR